MKKSALLAVSALSLGVVGLASFTPVVNAAVKSTQDATISVTVQGEIGIGGADGTQTPLNVTLGPISANDTATAESTITTTNNTDGNSTLSVKDKDDDNSLVGTNNANKIAASGNIVAGSEGWGIKGGNIADFTAVPVSGGTALTIGTDADRVDGLKSYTVTYGVSSSATTPADTYTDVVTYSVTAS